MEKKLKKKKKISGIKGFYTWTISETQLKITADIIYK